MAEQIDIEVAAEPEVATEPEVVAAEPEVALSRDDTSPGQLRRLGSWLGLQ